MKYILILADVFSGFHCSPKLSPDSGRRHQEWEVVEMKGVPMQQSDGRRDAHLNFDIIAKRFECNGDCNQINGNYSVDKKMIRFTEVLTTKMSCNDIEFENTFLAVLSSVDRYEVNGND